MLQGVNVAILLEGSSFLGSRRLAEAKGARDVMRQGGSMVRDSPGTPVVQSPPGRLFGDSALNPKRAVGRRGLSRGVKFSSRQRGEEENQPSVGAHFLCPPAHT